MTVEYQIIYWRDIPAQLKVRAAGARRLARELSDRFQTAIDEAAMRAGLTGTDDYLAAWHISPWQQCEAEMKVPGRASLEFEVQGHPRGSIIRQTAIFDPHGLWGQLYWYLIYPLHALVFRGMIRGVARAAQPGEGVVLS